MILLANHVLGCLDVILFGGSYPYMKPADIFLTALGTVMILLGLFADIFIPSPRRFTRLCLTILGIAAISTVLWHRM
jgi:hypothetical protein